MEFDRITMLLLSALYLTHMQRRVCQTLCIPPMDRKEKQNLHIYPAETLFEKFCVPYQKWEIDEKDYGKIVEEGFYPSVILTVFAIAFFAIIIIYNLSIYIGFIEFVLQGLVMAFAKPIRNLSSRLLTKHNIL